MFKLLDISFITAVLTFASVFAPAQSKIVKHECKLSKYGETPFTEIFPCELRLSAGNVEVLSNKWNFEFLAVEEGKTYVRINSFPLAFHKLGKYSLFVFSRETTTNDPRLNLV